MPYKKVVPNVLTYERTAEGALWDILGHQDIPAGPRQDSRKYFTIKYTAGWGERAYKIHLFCNINRIFI